MLVQGQQEPLRACVVFSAVSVEPLNRFPKHEPIQCIRVVSGKVRADMPELVKVSDLRQ